MCMCVCVTVHSRQRPAIGWNAAVWPPTASFSSSSIFWLCWPIKHPFIFTPVFMHRCVYLSITQSQSVINWFAIWNVFPHIQCWLLSVYLSSSVHVTVIDGVCVCLCATSVEPPCWFLDRRRSGQLGTNQLLQSLTVYPFITSKNKCTHIITHLISVADKSKINDQTLNKGRKARSDRSPLPYLQTVGTVLYVCVCVDKPHWFS